MRLKSLVPWPVKIVIKLLIAWLPVPHQVWKKLGVFEHSSQTPERYVEVVLRHRETLPMGKGFTVLELGPGDSVASAIVMAALGAEKTYLSDVGRFADPDPASYDGVARALRAKGLDPIDPGSYAGLEEMLVACRAEYFTGGLADLSHVPTGSVDLIWSQAVFEHVRTGDMAELLRQLRRISSRSGVSSHAIDMKDHLAGGLQNMRFPTRVWEAMASAGFYTNRLRATDFLAAFRGAGFSVQEERTSRWDAVPLQRRRLAPEFRHHSDEELKVHELAVVLTPDEPAQRV